MATTRYLQLNLPESIQNQLIKQVQLFKNPTMYQTRSCKWSNVNAAMSPASETAFFCSLKRLEELLVFNAFQYVHKTLRMQWNLQIKEGGEKKKKINIILLE